MQRTRAALGGRLRWTVAVHMTGWRMAQALAGQGSTAAPASPTLVAA